ncbi:MAG: preprotein translocase subunit YajC [Synergistaceae bacterium]|jgi:preprotein translocase YajC subunit|nr:preprotein translocase subunit YajC [Synergistaceae bacterium]
MPGGSTGVYAVTLVILLLVLFFGFILPDSRAKRALLRIRESLAVGDRIFTQAGLHGVIKAIDGDIILMETGEAKTEIEVARWSVLGIDRDRNTPPGKGA